MLPNHHLKTVGAVALALGALTPAVAAARPIAADPTQPTNTASFVQPNPPSVVRVVTANNGFDWGDAGIGAGGGIAISLLAAGGALAISQRRARRARGSAALTS